jgi:hypothetical protein
MQILYGFRMASPMGKLIALETLAGKLLHEQNYYCSSANNFLILYIIINQYPYLNNASAKISL